MGYYEPDTGYYDPSEFEEKCEELMDMLRSHVTDEIKSEMQRLREENSRMKDIVKNYDSKVSELESAKRKYEWNENLMRSKIETEFKRKRLSEILEGFQSEVWGVENVGKKKPKCDKCDEHRKIHFKSPSGKEYTEDCKCNKPTPFYEPYKLKCKSFKICNFDNPRRGKLIGWYKADDSGDYYSSSHICSDDMYMGQKYEDIEHTYNVYFETEEDAQKYADWLNKKRGKAK